MATAYDISKLVSHYPLNDQAIEEVVKLLTGARVAVLDHGEFTRPKIFRIAEGTEGTQYSTSQEAVIKYLKLRSEKVRVFVDSVEAFNKEQQAILYAEALKTANSYAKIF